MAVAGSCVIASSFNSNGKRIDSRDVSDINKYGIVFQKCTHSHIDKKGCFTPLYDEYKYIYFN